MMRKVSVRGNMSWVTFFSEKFSYNSKNLLTFLDIQWTAELIISLKNEISLIVRNVE